MVRKLADWEEPLTLPRVLTTERVALQDDASVVRDSTEAALKKLVSKLRRCKVATARKLFEEGGAAGAAGAGAGSDGSDGGDDKSWLMRVVFGQSTRVRLTRPELQQRMSVLCDEMMKTFYYYNGRRKSTAKTSRIHAVKQEAKRKLRKPRNRKRHSKTLIFGGADKPLKKSSSSSSSIYSSAPSAARSPEAAAAPVSRKLLASSPSLSITLEAPEVQMESKIELAAKAAEAVKPRPAPKRRKRKATKKKAPPMPPPPPRSTSSVPAPPPPPPPAAAAPRAAPPAPPARSALLAQIRQRKKKTPKASAKKRTRRTTSTPARQPKRAKPSVPGDRSDLLSQIRNVGAGVLQKTAIPRTPGGTPLENDQAAPPAQQSLIEAIRNKFKNALSDQSDSDSEWED